MQTTAVGSFLLLSMYVPTAANPPNAADIITLFNVMLPFLSSFGMVWLFEI